MAPRHSLDVRKGKAMMLVVFVFAAAALVLGPPQLSSGLAFVDVASPQAARQPPLGNFQMQTPEAELVASRRAALVLAMQSSGAASIAWGGSASSAVAETTVEEEACLSSCVYECLGGAKGKSDQFKDRSICIRECKEKCLPAQESGDLTVT